MKDYPNRVEIPAEARVAPVVKGCCGCERRQRVHSTNAVWCDECVESVMEYRPGSRNWRLRLL